MLNLGTQKEAAAAGVVFVWIVSFLGLVLRLQYNSINLLEYIPLITAVILGGFLGSYLGSFKYSAKTMEKSLGVVILIAIVFSRLLSYRVCEPLILFQILIVL